MKPHKIFLSAVSRQFDHCRRALASDLRAAGIEVVLEEDFHQQGRSLLKEIDESISNCDRVIALVGDDFGAEPPEGAAPEGRLRRSYSHWELAFAMGERLDGSKSPRKHLHVYFAGEAYLKAHPVDQDAQKRAIQERFRGAIAASGEGRGSFDTLDGLRRLALRDGFLVRDPDRKTIHLPDQSIGRLFKGRDTSLDDLRRRFSRADGREGLPAAQVMHGPGGVGKTRTAIEYAWKFACDYTALLFVSAPTPGHLHSRLADLVGILEIDTAATDVANRLDEVLRWLDAHPGWLLIVDNVDSEVAAAEVERLLARLTAGHVLITSRLADWGVGIERLELGPLAEADAIAFLLERTDRRLIAADDDSSAARLARELDGLVLALELAGACINRDRLRLGEYLATWRAREPEVLRWYRLRLMRYPKSVAVTWETTFLRLNEPERRLLEVLSWLAPEPIPRALLDAAPLSAFVTESRKALTGLAGYSLAQFGADADKVTIQRLVQELTRTRSVEPERGGSLDAALEAVNHQVPNDPDDVNTWEALGPLIAHAEAVAWHADSAEILAPTGRLMGLVALYHLARARHSAVEPLCRRALAICERSVGSGHPDVATALNSLALLLRQTGRLTEAEPMLRRALAAYESSYGPGHPDVATALNNLALLMQEMGRLSEAESLYRRALAISEGAVGAGHPGVATALNGLALLMRETGRLTEAEPMLRRAIAAYESSYGPGHPDVATALNNLASLLRATNRHSEAEPMLRRALAIYRSSYGPDHPDVATALNGLALLLRQTGRLTEAEPMLRRALAAYESSYGPGHPDVATALNNLALLMQETGRLSEAESLYRRALAISEDSYGADHPHAAIALNNLAMLLRQMGRLSEAERLHRRALGIFFGLARDTGHQHPHHRTAIGNYAKTLSELGHDAAAIRFHLDEVGRPFGFSFRDQGARGGTCISAPLPRTLPGAEKGHPGKARTPRLPSRPHSLEG